MPRPNDPRRRRRPDPDEEYLSEDAYEIIDDEADEYLDESEYIVERDQPRDRRPRQSSRRPPPPRQGSRQGPPPKQRSTQSRKSTPKVTPRRPKPPVVAVMWGFGMWLFFLISNTIAGFFDWAIQQFILFMFAVGVFSALNNVPVLGFIQRDIDKLIDHYDRHPNQLKGVGLFLRLVPPFSIFITIRDFAVLAPILIVGIPLDIGLEAFTQYVLGFNGWGKASTMSFPMVIGYEFFLTVTCAPYLVLSAMSVRLFQR